MCLLLKVSRANVSKYTPKSIAIDPETSRVKRIFKDNQGAYGTRRIQAECAWEGTCISRRRIARIMKQEGLVSRYTIAHFKPQKQACNETRIKNIVNRQFDDRQKSEVIVSDLTYVRVGTKWHDLCTLLDLHN